MIRVLQVVTDMGRGGLETFLMNYYREIDRNRIQFDFLMHRDYRSDYDDEIESLGGIIYRVNRLNPFSQVYRKQLEDFFHNHPEYQIVHVHQDCLSSIILKAAERQRVKIRIAHAHSSSQNKDLKYPIKLFYRHFIPKYATHLAACSKAAGDWMFRGKPYDLIHNAIDASKYTFSPVVRETIRKELNISDDVLAIGHVGRFSPPKNHAFLIDVFYEIHKKTKSKLMLIGDGFLRSKIEAQIKELNLKDDVILTGIQMSVYRYLQAMDVFVFPSIYEGLPLSIIEAQAAGLPCLISDKVPLECKVTSLLQQIELSKGPKYWAFETIKVSEMERKDSYEDIVRSGYDIRKNAEKLMGYYEKLSNK